METVSLLTDLNLKYSQSNKKNQTNKNSKTTLFNIKQF